MKPWQSALGTTLLMQAVASFMNQALPVVAPLLSGSVGLAPEAIGTLSALTAAGTVLFLAAGGPVLARFGPVRMLQGGALLSALAMAVSGIGTVPALLLGSFLLGVGYGPTPPSGSRILAATAPKGHRTLIFSIKQAGAPLGGMLAGVVMAPVAESFGWGAALLLGAAVAIVAALLINGQRRMLDLERDATRAIGPRALFRPAALAAPFGVLLHAGALLPLSLLAVSFAVVQGCLFSFTVTWLVETHGMTLVQAGSAFAVLQGAGVVARVSLGWLADRTGRPIVNLLLQAGVATGAILVFASLPADTGHAAMLAMAGVVGFVAASWNGIYLAEVARLAPPDRVADATSGSTMLTFLGYVAGPALFARGVAWTGGWTVSMLGMALQLSAMALVMAPILLRADRRARQD
jgi:MFS family permease